MFRTWADGLPPELEVWPVQLPGRESRLKEPAYTRLAPLVETLAQVLQPHLSMPFAFFGHSMGALISFELARQLRPYGQTPAHLFVSGRRAPHLPDIDPPIYHLPQPEFIEELRRLQGTPEAVLQSAELMALILPCLRADFAVCETYAHAESAALDCPISAFGGTADPKVSRADLDAWRNHTQGAFSLRMFAGDHFFLHSARANLLQAIRGDLTEVLRRAT
jgi:medium-chain acyl-[acyl-carrier-protein] hydrolase